MPGLDAVRQRVDCRVRGEDHSRTRAYEAELQRTQMVPGDLTGTFQYLQWITGSRIQTWPRKPSRTFSFGVVVEKRAWALLGRAFFYQGESLARTIQLFRPRFSNDALINHSAERRFLN